MSDNGKVHILELHGRAYELHKLPATKAVVLMTRLSRLFGDPLMRLLVGGASQVKGASEPVTDQALDVLAQRLQVFEHLKDDDVLDLARLIFPYVLLGNAQIYKGNDLDIDMKFAGYELDIFPVLLEAVRYNFGPFIEGFRSRFPNVLGETATTGSSP